MNNRNNGVIRIDARIRVLLAALLSVLSVMLREDNYLFLFTGLVCMIMILSGVIRSALVQSMTIILCCFLPLILGEWITGVTRVFILTILQILPRLLFLRMLGTSLTKILSIGEMIETLERLRLPRQIVIPFAVMLRYLPTMKLEMHYIRDSLKIRGIDYSVLAFLKAPVKWMEYMLVPILMRSIRLADELAATAMVRGIENHTKRAWIYENIKIRNRGIYHEQ